MPRVRSPNYPALSLPDAIRRIGAAFEKEHRHPMSKEVAVKALGYGGVNGASLGALSAVFKYGLLERQGENFKVSDRAVAILHPHTPEEKAQAIQQAAAEPSLFKELTEQFQGRPPSDDNLRAYLVRRGFANTALSGVIQSFRETMELARRQTAPYDAKTVRAETDEEPRSGGEGEGSTAPKKPWNPSLEDMIGSMFRPIVNPLERQAERRQQIEPKGQLKVMFTGDHLQVAAVITNRRELQRLVQALKANEALLTDEGSERDRERVQQRDRNGTQSQEDRPASVSLMITQEQKSRLREMGYSDDKIRDMRPDEAHRVLGLLE